jgi:ribose 5-phosphate isomerase A
MKVEEAKKAAGYKAAELIQKGMVVGLGTGTTAHYFIERLAMRCKEGLPVKAVASSKQSLELARQRGIPLENIDKLTHVDITVDGADEIDPQKRMIKGGGGALVREKILANMSRELIIIVDETKCVSQLGKAKLPVEIIPFAPEATRLHIEKLGFKGKWRQNPDHSFYLSDNGNRIFDIHFDHTLSHPEKEHETLSRLPGVVDTGFFFNLAGRVIVAFFDGQIVVRE